MLSDNYTYSKKFFVIKLWLYHTVDGRVISLEALPILKPGIEPGSQPLLVSRSLYTLHHGSEGRHVDSAQHASSVMQGNESD
jgi:hypothetical protein